MPTFDYTCTRCGHEENDLIVASYRAVITCRACWARCGEEQLMTREYPTRPPVSHIKGFSEANGYSKSDEALRPSRIPGIKTSVKAL